MVCNPKATLKKDYALLPFFITNSQEEKKSGIMNSSYYGRGTPIIMGSHPAVYDSSPSGRKDKFMQIKQCVCPTTTPISNSFLKSLHPAGSCSEAVGYLHLNQAQASLPLPNNAGLPNPHHCSSVRLVFSTFLLLLNHRISGCLGTGEAKLGEGQLRGGILLSETPLPHPWSSPSAFEMEPSHRSL